MYSAGRRTHHNNQINIAIRRVCTVTDTAERFYFVFLAKPETNGSVDLLNGLFPIREYLERDGRPFRQL